MKLVIDALREVMKRHESLKAVIVGFSNAPEHAAVTARIAEHIDAGPFSERFIKHPFAGRERLCELYNGSDIAFFARASISCQETLGTGLIGCLVDDGSLKHLITMPGQGVFFKPGDERDLVAKLEEAQRPLDHLQGPEREKFRRELADGSRWLGYDRIIDATLRELQRREGTQPALRQAQSA